MIFKIFIGVLLTLSTALACGPDCYEDKNASKLEKILSERWKNDIIFDTSYQSIDSKYNDLGSSSDSISTVKLDWMSQIKITDRLGLTSTVRAISLNNSSDFKDRYPDTQGRDLNMIGNEGYNDIYFRALYLTYILPDIGDYKHMLAVGTMPFQGGSWTNYKTGRPQEANGLSMLFDMPFDAITYVADISKLTNMDFFQVRVGYGEYMKFRDLYPQNEHLGLTPYDTTVAFINFDMKEGSHNIKLEAYQTKWVFEGSPIGTVDALGLGYAYDRMNEDGYVVYGTVGVMRAVGSYDQYITQKLTENRDKLIAGFMQKYSIDYATAAAMVDAQLANITPEFVAQVQGLTVDDTGLNAGDTATGWAFQVGGKKEFWWEEFDIYPYVGFEYFHSSKDWVSTTLRGFPRNGIDPLIKGEATDLYAGIRFDNSKILTFSWIHENRKWSPTAINDVVGITADQTDRNILTQRDTFRVDFTWMFLGL